MVVRFFIVACNSDLMNAIIGRAFIVCVINAEARVLMSGVNYICASIGYDVPLKIFKISRAVKRLLPGGSFRSLKIVLRAEKKHRCGVSGRKSVNYFWNRKLYCSPSQLCSGRFHQGARNQQHLSFFRSLFAIGQPAFCGYQVSRYAGNSATF